MRGKLIDDDTEYKVWLVWKLIGNRPTLVAIDTSEIKADKHVAYDKATDQYLNRPLSEYFVEESLLNHLYGQSIDGSEPVSRSLKSSNALEILNDR